MGPASGKAARRFRDDAPPADPTTWPLAKISSRSRGRKKLAEALAELPSTCKVTNGPLVTTPSPFLTPCAQASNADAPGRALIRSRSGPSRGIHRDHVFWRVRL